jgi:hypothetical protein
LVIGGTGEISKSKNDHTWHFYSYRKGVVTTRVGECQQFVKTIAILALISREELIRLWVG